MSRRRGPKSPDGWLYGAKDADGIELYVGKHVGPQPDKRVHDHRRADAEFMRHVRHVDIDMVPPEGILDDERIHIEKANDGQGTVFNKNHNAVGWPQRYYDGYSSRWDPDEQPDRGKSRERRSRAADHPGYVGREAERRLQRRLRRGLDDGV